MNHTLEKLEIDKAILPGYSMGGRAALTYTFSFPGKVAGLILESTTAGIDSESERRARQENDKQIADSILQNGIENFVDFWMNIPLFSSQKKLPLETLVNIKKNKLKNSPRGLANSLLGFGTGTMPSYWHKLKELAMPVQLITGSLDEKYDNINRHMSSIIPDANHKVIENAGHNTHLEKASEFIILVNSFLKNNYC